MGNRIILSPHFDDAVFSCWHLINQPGSEVITIFAGVPPNETSTLWDKLCGESNSTQMMYERTEENKIALKGIITKNLGYLDNQYRSKEKLDVKEIAENILSLVSPGSHFFVPQAYSKLWRHPDHVFVRKVGEYLLNQGSKVSFYVDIPYIWIPSKVTDQYKKRLTNTLHDHFDINFSTQIYDLGEDEQNAKREAMMKYRSQYKMTSIVSLGSLRRKANLEHEIYCTPV
jgi:hypothetical protein